MARGTELSARIRAARAWADLERKPFGDAIGVSERQVSRYEAGTAAPDADMRRRIAEVCGVPPAFMDLGFGPLEAPLDDAQRAAHELQSQITELRAAVIELAAGNLRQTRKRLGMSETDRPSESEGEAR